MIFVREASAAVVLVTLTLSLHVSRRPRTRGPLRPNSYPLPDFGDVGPGQSRDFLGRRHVPLSEVSEADLDREAAVFEAGSRRAR
jgi:hypothetical protein